MEAENNGREVAGKEDMKNVWKWMVVVCDHGIWSWDSMLPLDMKT